jgi:hypothetical protein
MALTSSGTPDHAAARKSGRDMVDACSSFLNLFILVMRELIASDSLEVALPGVDGYVMRCRALAGSEKGSG